MKNRSRSELAFEARGCLVAAAVALALGVAQSPRAQAQEQAADDLAEITVTGSRIVRRDLEAASPVVTVETRAFEESSTLAVESVLNQLPQFVPANTQFNTSDVFPSATSTPGISTVSLRGLGAQRTLVLVDGRRAQPVNSTLVIDTNSIPSSALESVEIITGGASATYGADALSGVTNFKLRENFEGMDLQFRTGITERGDGEEHRASLLLGAKTAEGRGSVLVGMEWTQRGEVLAIDRPFYEDALKDPNTSAGANGRMNGYQYLPSFTNMASRTAFQNAANALYPRSTYTQLPAGYVVPITTEFNFNTDGTLYKRERAGLGFKGDIVNDPNYKITPARTLIQTNRDLRYSSPLERYSLFGKGTFEINDHVSAFSQVNFVNSETKQVLQPTGAVGAGFGAQIPYSTTAIYGPSRAPNGSTLPQYLSGGALGLSCPATGGCTYAQAFPVSPQLASLLNARGPDVFAQSTANANNPNPLRSFDPITGVEIPVQGSNAPWNLGATTDFLPARTIVNNTNLFQLLGGLKGDLGLSDWTWEAYISHGATRTDLDYVGFLSTRRFQAVVQSPNYGRNVTITGPGGSSLTCTSGLPVFQQFAVTQDCINAITGTFTDRTRLTQDIVEATAQGKIIDLPAGELRGALGVTRRKNEFQYLPDAIREANDVVDMIVGAFPQANVRGQTVAKEAYAEVLVPVLRDVFLAKTLELELGYRYSEYDNGSVSTYKALASWAPLDWLRFRGGYQLANRAPNINELYLDASSTAVTLRSLDYCQSTTQEVTGNNPRNANRAAAQALCQALIGNTNTPFTTDPNNYQGGRTDAGVMVQISRGNPNLKSEEGKTWTLGAVIRSPFENPLASGITLSADWYNVEISDAIALVSAQTAYDLCFNRDGTSNPTYSINDVNGACANIRRDAVTGAATNVTSTYTNTGTVETSGLDLTFDWRAAIADMGLESIPGNLSANVSFNKTFKFRQQAFDGGPLLENVGTLGDATRGALFDWRTVTTLRYSNTGFGVSLNWRHLPSIRSNVYVTDKTTPQQGASSYDIFGLTGDWDITSNLAISGGIDNLLDKDPERTGIGQVVNIAAGDGGGTTVLNGSGTTTATFYDVLGRRYFLNLKLRF